VAGAVPPSRPEGNADAAASRTRRRVARVRRAASSGAQRRDDGDGARVMHASRAAIVAARARIDVRRDDEPESSSNPACAETPNAPRAPRASESCADRENARGGGRARAVKERLIRSPSIAGDVGRRRPALSPLPNGTVGERTTPLRYARARMVETIGKGTSDGTGAASVEGCDRASDAVASTSGTSRAARERELVAFMKDMAKRADAQKRELDDARRELDDVLDALAAAEFERETFENELKHAMKIEREALEFSILHENAARMKERERVVELETVLAERDTQIQSLTAAAARSRARRGPSRAARRAAANLRDEVRDILRAELRAEIADELLAKRP